MSNIPDEDEIRDAVAGFIRRNAEDPECLHEIIYDLFTGDASDEEFDDANDLAYGIFDKARVYIVIDEVEYS